MLRDVYIKRRYGNSDHALHRAEACGRMRDGSCFQSPTAAKSDFAFCWPIYRDALQPLTLPPAEWREPDHQRIVERALADAGSSILRSEDPMQAGCISRRPARSSS
jgi:hypothetical protein